VVNIGPSDNYNFEMCQIGLTEVVIKVIQGFVMAPLDRPQGLQFGFYCNYVTIMYCFYRAMLYASAVGLYAVIVCPSARPSIRHKSEFYQDGYT